MQASTHLRCLELLKCCKQDVLDRLEEVCRHTGLKRLWFQDCLDLTELPATLSLLRGLQRLRLVGFKSLKSLPVSMHWTKSSYRKQVLTMHDIDMVKHYTR